MVYLLGDGKQITGVECHRVPEIDELYTLDFLVPCSKFYEYILSPKIAIINSKFMQRFQELAEHSNQPSEMTESLLVLSNCFVKWTMLNLIMAG